MSRVDQTMEIGDKLAVARILLMGRLWGNGLRVSFFLSDTNIIKLVVQFCKCIKNIRL